MKYLCLISLLILSINTNIQAQYLKPPSNTTSHSTWHHIESVGKSGKVIAIQQEQSNLIIYPLSTFGNALNQNFRFEDLGDSTYLIGTRPKSNQSIEIHGGKKKNRYVNDQNIGIYAKRKPNNQPSQGFRTLQHPTDKLIFEFQVVGTLDARSMYIGVNDKSINIELMMTKGVSFNRYWDNYKTIQYKFEPDYEASKDHILFPTKYKRTTRLITG